MTPGTLWEPNESNPRYLGVKQNHQFDLTGKVGFI